MNIDKGKIIADNEKLIWNIANKFYGVDKDDLFQAGIVGLLKALKNYKKNGTTKFSSYAYDYIFGEMYLLASNKTIKVSKDILKLYKRIENTRYTLAQKLNRVPTNIELSEYIGIPLEAIEKALNSANMIMSLDSSSESDRSLYESIPTADENIDTKIVISDSFKVLDEEEKDIIKSRYFEDLTQSEVAKKLNMTQVMVSRYEKKSISKMRDYLTM